MEWYSAVTTKVAGWMEGLGCHVIDMGRGRYRYFTKYGKELFRLHMLRRMERGRKWWREKRYPDCATLLIILFICVYSFGRAPVYLSESLRASGGCCFSLFWRGATDSYVYYILYFFVCKPAPISIWEWESSLGDVQNRVYYFSRLRVWVARNEDYCWAGLWLRASASNIFWHSLSFSYANFRSHRVSEPQLFSTVSRPPKTRKPRRW